MNERIKKLRKTLNLTQQDFAEQLGTTRNNIAGYEIGRRAPSVAVISLICREFNVSETWLRTGEGEMFVPSPNGALDELAQKYGLSTRSKAIVEKFLDLKPEVQEAIAVYIEEVAAAFADVETAASVPVLTPVPDASEQAPADRPLSIDEQVELYRQHLLLEEERAKQALSVKESGGG